MKGNKSIWIWVLLLICGSCQKDPTVTDMLTEVRWGKPEILHQPAGIGWFVITNCPGGQSYKYGQNGDYSFHDYCLDHQMEGEWKWITQDRELKLNTYFQGVFQYGYIITILEITENRLRTRQRMEGDPEGRYFEFLFNPRNG